MHPVVKKFLFENPRHYKNFFGDTLNRALFDLDITDFSVRYQRQCVTVLELTIQNKKITLIHHHDNVIGSIGLKKLQELINGFQENTVVVLSSLINLERQMPIEKFHYVYFGSDYLLQSQEYPKLIPVTEKSIADRHWISLAYKSRPARQIAALLLLGQNLEQHGVLRISPGQAFDKYSWQQLGNFDISNIQPWVDTLNCGFVKFKEQRTYAGHKWQPYPQGSLDNVANFDRDLRYLYQHSLVEIVNETTFFEPAGLITEKYLNSVYGCNLPIVLSSAGTVTHLRNLGFDMFDDVVDHGYDLVEDPMLRLVTAIDSNKKLLENKDYAQQCWTHCRDRFEKNVEFARNEFYQREQQKIVKNLRDVIHSLVNQP